LALAFDGERLILREQPIPTPAAGEALIKVRLAGICNTDLEIVRGYMGFRGVLGHEFVGEVAAAPDPAWVGQRVVGEINAYCGACDTCRSGAPTHCPNRTTLGIAGRDGALAEYCTLPVHCLHPVPDGVSDEEAVFVEPLAAALEIPEQAHIRPTERVIVVGDGKLGLLVAQVLALTGCDLACVGRHGNKLALLQRLGIETRLAAEVAGLRADCVVDCTGHPEGFALARSILRPRGRLILKSTYHGRIEADLTGLVVDEIALVGSRCGPFAPALRLLQRRLVDVTGFIDSQFRLEDGLAAFARAGTRGVLKVLVRPV